MEYKAYSFDLDDNLLKLPTLVYLKDKDDKMQGFTTLEFEEVRTTLDKLGLRVTADSFKNFDNDEQFLIDVKKSTKAGSWTNLVNCIVQHASIFAIITARRHSPAAIKKGMRFAIMKNITEKQLDKFANKFCDRYDIRRGGRGAEDILDDYLKLCRFYPVSNAKVREKFGGKDVSEMKSLVFEEFQDYIRKHVKENFGEKTKVKIGFSDDSIHHLNKMVNDILKRHGLFFYQTKEEGKTNFI